MIVCSGHDSRDLVRSLGPTAHALRKPVELDELEALIERLARSDLTAAARRGRTRRAGNVNPFLRVARYAWASPCTLTGLLLVSPAFLFGARARVVDGVIEVANPLFEGPSEKKLWPFRAITFGHVVIGESMRDLALLRAHEHAHVRQYEKWGVFFFIAYPMASLWQLLSGGRPYLDNWFEAAARAEARRERFK